MDDDDSNLDQAVQEHASYLGFSSDLYPELLPIAREALLAPLPTGWSEAQDTGGNVYYYNAQTKQSSWEHPLDAMYRQRVQTALSKLNTARVTQPTVLESQRLHDEVPLLQTPKRSQVTNLHGSRKSSITSPSIHLHVAAVSPAGPAQSLNLGSPARPSIGGHGHGHGNRHGNGQAQHDGYGQGSPPPTPLRRAQATAAMSSTDSPQRSRATTAALNTSQQNMHFALEGLHQAEQRLAAVPSAEELFQLGGQVALDRTLDSVEASHAQGDNTLAVSADTTGQTTGLDASTGGEARHGERRLSISQRLLRLVSTIKTESDSETVRAERESSRADRADVEAEHESLYVRQLLATQGSLLGERNAALAELERTTARAERLSAELNAQRTQPQDGTAAQALQRELSELRKIHDGEVQRSEQLTFRLSELTHEREMLAVQMSTIDREVSSLHALAQAERSGRQSAEEAVLRQETQVRVLQDQVTHVTSQLEGARGRYDRDLSSVKEQLTAARATVSAQTSEWEAQLSAVQGRVRNLESQLASEHRRNDELQSELHTARSSSTSEDEALQAQLTHLQQQVDAARQQALLIERERDEIRGRWEGTFTDLKAAGDIVDRLQAELSANRAQLAESQGRIIDLEYGQGQSEEEISAMQRQLARVRIEFEASRAREGSLQDTITGAEALRASSAAANAVSPRTPSRAQQHAQASPAAGHGGFVSPGRYRKSEEHVTELQSEIESLTLMLSHLRAELQEQTAALLTAASAHEQATARYEGQIDELGQRIQALEAEAAEAELQAQTSSAQLQQEVNASEAEIASLRAELVQLHAVADEVPSLRQELAAAVATQEQIELLRTRLERASQLSDELIAAKQQLAEQQAREKALTALISELQASLEGAKGAEVHSMDALLEAKAQIEQQSMLVAELTHTVEQHLHLQADLSANLETAEGAVVAAEAQAAEAEATRHVLQLQVRALEQAQLDNAAAHEAQMAVLQHQHKDTLTTVAQHQASTLTFTAEIAALRSEVDSARALFEGQLSTCAALQAKVETLSADLATALSAQTSTVDATAQRMTALQTDLTAALHSVAELRGCVASLEGAKGTLQAQLHQATQMHEQAQLAFESGKQKDERALLELQQRCEALEVRVQHAEQILLARSAELQVAQGKVVSLESQCEAQASQLQALRASTTATEEVALLQSTHETERVGLVRAHESVLGEVRTRQNALERELSSVHATLASARNDASTATFMRDKADAEVSRLTDSLGDALRMLKEVEGERDIVTRQRDTVTQDRAVAIAAVDRALAEAARAASAHGHAEERISMLQSELESMQRLADAGNSALQRQVLELQGQMASARGEAVSAAAAAQNTVAQLELAQAHHAAAMAAVSSEHAVALSRSGAELERVQADVSTARRELASVHAQAQAQAHAHAQAQAQQSQAHEEALAEAQAQVAVLELARDEAVADAQQSAIRLVAVTAERDTADKSSAEATRISQEAQAELPTLRAQVDAAREELHALRESSSSSTAATAAETDVLIDELAAVRAELATSIAALDSALGSCESLQLRVSELESALAHAQAMFSQKVTELASLQAQATKGLDLVEKLNALLQTESESVGALRAELSVAQAQWESERVGASAQLAQATSASAAAEAKVQELQELLQQQQQLADAELQAARVASEETNRRAETERAAAHGEEVQSLQALLFRAEAEASGVRERLASVEAELATARSAAERTGAAATTAAAEAHSARQMLQARLDEAVLRVHGMEGQIEAERAAHATQIETAARETAAAAQAAAAAPSSRTMVEQEVVAMSPASPVPAEGHRRVRHAGEGSPDPAHGNGQGDGEGKGQAVDLSPVLLRRRAEPVHAETENTTAEDIGSLQAALKQAGGHSRRGSVASGGTHQAAEIHVHLHGMHADEAAVVQPLDVTQGVMGGFQVVTKHAGAPSYRRVPSLVQERTVAAPFIPMPMPTAQATTLGPASLRGIHAGDLDLLTMARKAELSTSTLRVLQDLGVNIGGQAFTEGSTYASGRWSKAGASSSGRQGPGQWAARYGLDATAADSF